MYNEPTLIVGTGRSGTSLTAGMLWYTGVWMGRDLVEADSNNPAGHWEDKMFKKLNLMFLQGDIDEEEFKDKLEKQIDHRAASYEFSAIKVPSVAQLLPYYLDVIPNAKVIWCYRDPEDVIESMQNAYDWEKDKCEELTYSRLEQIQRAADDGKEMMKVNMEELIAEPKRHLSAFIQYLDLRPSDKEIERALDLVVNKDFGKDTKIFMGIPNEGWIHRAVVASTLMMLKDDRYNCTHRMPTNTPYEKTANILCHQAVENDCDYLLLYDSDNPPGKNPLDLVELDKDIIILPTPTPRGDGTHFVTVDHIPERDTFKTVPKHRRQGLQEVDAGGSGCILIKTEVLEDIIEDGETPFEPKMSNQGKDWATGDFQLCKKARERGYKVWAHWDYQCDHVKEMPVQKVRDMKPKDHN